jgi:hypothetical protein
MPSQDIIFRDAITSNLNYHRRRVKDAQLALDKEDDPEVYKDLAEEFRDAVASANAVAAVARDVGMID